MRPNLLTHLDAHWAARLHCESNRLRNLNTNIIADPQRTNAEVWLFDKTCVMIAEPGIARTLKASVGTRSPMVAFEPGRLREAVADLGLDIQGPESIMVFDGCADIKNDLHWLVATETESELGATAREVAATGIPLVSIPLNQRLARRAAESCGFELYATVIYIGNKSAIAEGRGISRPSVEINS